MPLRAKSMPADELTKRASAAAKEVLADRMDLFGDSHIEIGVFPDIGVVGLIWRNPDFDRFKLGTAFEASAKITEAIGPLAGGAQPTVQIFRVIGTMGYFPSGPIIFDRFR